MYIFKKLCKLNIQNYVHFKKNVYVEYTELCTFFFCFEKLHRLNE